MSDEPYPRYRKAILQSFLSATWAAGIVGVAAHAMPSSPRWILAVPAFVVTFAFAFVIVAFRPNLGGRHRSFWLTPLAEPRHHVSPPPPRP